MTSHVSQLEQLIKKERAKHAAERQELDARLDDARRNAQQRAAEFLEFEDAVDEATHIATLAVKRHKVRRAPCRL